MAMPLEPERNTRVQPIWLNSVLAADTRRDIPTATLTSPNYDPNRILFGFYRMSLNGIFHQTASPQARSTDNSTIQLKTYIVVLIR
jgi:hypothetical protein